MSGAETPTSEGSGGSRTRVTRTVAIIKHHALRQRMEIEERIQKAGFEVRQTLKLKLKCDIDMTRHDNADRERTPDGICAKL